MGAKSSSSAARKGGSNLSAASIKHNAAGNNQLLMTESSTGEERKHPAATGEATSAPPSSSKHPILFLSHRQGDWGDQCSALSSELTVRGICETWFDKNYIYGDLTSNAMVEGARNCTVYVIFLSPSLQKQPPKRQEDLQMVCVELKAAVEAGKPIVPVLDNLSGAPERFVENPAALMKNLAAQIGRKDASFFGEPIQFVKRRGARLDSMITEILSRGGHPFAPLSDGCASDVDTPDVVIAGPPGSAACDLIEAALRTRSFPAQLLDTSASLPNVPASAKAVVFYLVKNQSAKLKKVYEMTKKLGKTMIIMYENSPIRPGCLSSYDEASKEFAQLDHVKPDTEYLPFTNETRRFTNMDALVQTLISRFRSPVMNLTFDPFFIPRSLASKYEPQSREWFFDTVATKMSELNEKLVSVIDTAGFGKSVLMAEFCRRGGVMRHILPAESNGRFRVIGMHFFDSTIVDTVSPFACFQSISVMLCSNVTGFRERLPLNLHKLVRNKTTEQLLDLLIVNPLEELFPSNSGRAPFESSGGCWIVMDGLDECEEPLEVFRAVTKLRGRLPWLRFLISMRNSPDSADAATPSTIITLAPHQQQDLKEYIQKRLERSWKAAQPDVKASMVNKLLQLSEGSFVWFALQEVQLHEIASSPNALKLLNQLPEGLDAVYKVYFDGLKGAFKTNDKLFKRVVASSLLVPRTPIPESLWMEVLNVSNYTETVRRPSSKLIVFKDGVVKAPHLSMRDWLEKQPVAQDRDFLKSLHSDLVAIASKMCTKSLTSADRFNPLKLKASEDQANEFALNHLIYHAIHGEQFGIVVEWFLDFDRLLLWVARTPADLIITDSELVLESFHDPKTKGINQQSLQKDAVVAIAGLLALAVPAIRRDPRELAGQLLGRLPANHPILPSVHKWLKVATGSRGLKVMVPSQHFSELTATEKSLVRIVRGHKEMLNKIYVDPHDRLMLTCSSDGTARVYSNQGKAFLTEFAGHTASVTCGILVELNNTVWALTGSDDFTCKRWNALGGGSGSSAVVEYKGHTNAIWAVHYDPVNKRIATGSWDCTVRVWSWEGGKCLHVLKDHKEALTDVHIQGSRVISASDAVRIFDGEKLLHTIPLRSGLKVTAMAVTDTLIVAASDDGTIDRIRIDDGELLGTSIHNGGARLCALDVLDEWLVTGSEDHRVRLWNLDELTNDGEVVPFAIFEGHTSWVSCVRLAPDKRRVLSGSWDTSVRIWNIPTTASSSLLAVTESHTSYTTCVAMLGEGAVASGSLDKTVRVWSIESGEQVAKYQVPFGVMSIRLVSGAIEATGENEQGKKMSVKLDDPRAAAAKSPPEVKTIVTFGMHVLETSSSVVGFTADDDASGSFRSGKWIVGTSGNRFRLWFEYH